MLRHVRGHLTELQCLSCLRQVRCYSERIRKRDRKLYAAENLPVFDYAKVQTARRRIYVFGSTTCGALGLASLLKPKLVDQKKVVEYIARPVRSDFGGIEDIQDVAAGHGFTIVRVKPRRNPETSPIIFGTGRNTHSQLGYQSVRAEAPMETLISFVPITLTTSNSAKRDMKVLAIGAGRGHSLISIEGQGMLALGDNSSGQCGRLSIPDEQYFGSKYLHRIQKFGSGPEDEVLSIVSRFDVSLCLTRGGKVYSFGSNGRGQLGRGRKLVKYWEPTEVNGGDLQGETITKLTTNGNSVVALNDKGQLFSWGCNELGQVNPYDAGQTFFEPRFVPLSSKLGKIIDVSVSELTSHIVNEQGNVYTWGRGTCLGLGPKNMSVKSPTIMPPPLFGRNEFNPDVKVEKVFSGFFYAAAVTSGGDMYSWGKNESGCLGLGLDDGLTQFFPLKVCLNGFVEKVCIGVDHTVVLSRGGI